MGNIQLENALNYLAKGYSVICVGLDKRPLVSWKDYQSRRASIEEVLQWWEKYPDAQVGIVTGSISDLTVVDIEEGGNFDLIKDETFTVRTGGKGIHYYYKYDKDFQNAVRLLPLTDLRSEGGYVVAGGSISAKGEYIVTKDLPVARMSDVTKKLLMDAKKPAFSVFDKSTTSAVLDTTIPDYPGYGKGQRNDQTAKHIGSILARIHPSEWESKGWTFAQQANQKNQPPLPEYELRATWNSLKSREMSQNPLGRTRSTFESKDTSFGPTVAPVVIKDDLRDRRATIMHASEVAASQVIDTDHTYAVGMKPFDEALLGGFSVGDLIAVAGKTGVGKTTIIQDWTVSLASGRNGEYEGLPSLWFSYEVLARPLWAKFEAIGADTSTPIYLPSYNESGNSEWVIEMIKNGIAEKGIKVVAIDHLGFLRPPKGNYSNQADAITHTVRMLKQLAVECGLIIMLPVHVKKTRAKDVDLDDIKDSSGIAQEADTVFFIDRVRNGGGVTDQTKVWLSKNRKTGAATSGIFDFKFGRFFFNEQATKEDGDMVESNQKADEVWERSESARVEKSIKEEEAIAEKEKSDELEKEADELLKQAEMNLPYAEDKDF